MAKFVILLVCLAVFVHSGHALKCYMCNSEKQDGCIKHMSPKEQPCGNPGDGTQFVCYYRTAYDNKRKVSIANSTCEQIPKGSSVDKGSVKECTSSSPDIEIKECRVCNTDLCNSAPAFSTSFATFACLPIMYFFTKLVLH